LWCDAVLPIGDIDDVVEHRCGVEDQVRKKYNPSVILQKCNVNEENPDPPTIGYVRMMNNAQQRLAVLMIHHKETYARRRL
jgi:hypothetical protein